MTIIEQFIFIRKKETFCSVAELPDYELFSIMKNLILKRHEQYILELLTNCQSIFEMS